MQQEIKQLAAMPIVPAFLAPPPGQDNFHQPLVVSAATFDASALHKAILNSANFLTIATDAKGVIQVFNVGAERMLGYAAAEVVNKITPADISDPQEVTERAMALSLEFKTTLLPGFEALAIKASRGLEDIYELTYIRKDGSRFPAAVSVTPLRDDREDIIGYLLIGTDNTARKLGDVAHRRFDQLLQEKNAELESAKVAAEKINVAKSEFLVSMSQELRIPLNAILGFAQLLESDSSPATAGQKDSITQILASGWHLLTLINEMLDLAKAASSPAPAAKAEAAILVQPLATTAVRPRTLLYVEDDPANLKLVGQVIARHPGSRLLTAVSGKSGIDMARISQPDVILMDIMLPGIDGFAALKVLRADPATVHIPVIAISGDAIPRDIDQGLKAGFFRYLTKPIKINELVEVLDLAWEFAKKHAVNPELGPARARV